MTIEFLIDKNLEPSKKEEKKLKKIIKTVSKKPTVKPRDYLQKAIFLRRFTLALMDAGQVVQRLEAAEKKLEEAEKPKEIKEVKKEFLEKAPLPEKEIPNAPFYINIYKKLKSKFQKVPIAPKPIKLQKQIERIPQIKELKPIEEEMPRIGRGVITHEEPFKMGINKKALKESLSPEKLFLPKLPKPIKFKSS